ncbi:hypothetical protein JCM10449v2_004686 [Rhodotorula kratochvilovae]
MHAPPVNAEIPVKASATVDPNLLDASPWLSDQYRSLLGATSKSASPLCPQYRLVTLEGKPVTFEDSAQIPPLLAHMKASFVNGETGVFSHSPLAVDPRFRDVFRVQSSLPGTFKFDSLLRNFFEEHGSITLDVFAHSNITESILKVLADVRLKQAKKDYKTLLFMGTAAAEDLKAAIERLERQIRVAQDDPSEASFSLLAAATQHITQMHSKAMVGLSTDGSTVSAIVGSENLSHNGGGWFKPNGWSSFETALSLILPYGSEVAEQLLHDHQVARVRLAKQGLIVNSCDVVEKEAIATPEIVEARRQLELLEREQLEKVFAALHGDGTSPPAPIFDDNGQVILRITQEKVASAEPAEGKVNGYYVCLDCLQWAGTTVSARVATNKGADLCSHPTTSAGAASSRPAGCRLRLAVGSATLFVPQAAVTASGLALDDYLKGLTRVLACTGGHFTTSKGEHIFLRGPIYSFYRKLPSKGELSGDELLSAWKTYFASLAHPQQAYYANLQPSAIGSMCKSAFGGSVYHALRLSLGAYTAVADHAVRQLHDRIEQRRESDKKQRQRAEQGPKVEGSDVEGDEEAEGTEL